MLRTLLVCGLLAGASGGVVGFAFASAAGEGSVDAAIAFEESSQEAAGEPQAPPVVSRGEQRGAGLLTATVVYGVALGGVFALVFAAVYGRVADAPPARTALWLAGIAFLVVFLVPFLKYPANPPATGDPETIQKRTLLHLTMLVTSVLSAVAGIRVRTLVRRSDRLRRYGAAAGVAAYGLLAGLAMLVLPGVSEIPAGFPATTLYDFRASTVGLQLSIWATIGLAFAVLAERRIAAAAGVPARGLGAGR